MVTPQNFSTILDQSVSVSLNLTLWLLVPSPSSSPSSSSSSHPRAEASACSAKCSSTMRERRWELSCSLKKLGDTSLRAGSNHRKE